MSPMVPIQQLNSHLQYLGIKPQPCSDQRWNKFTAQTKRLQFYFLDCIKAYIFPFKLMVDIKIDTKLCW